LIYTTVLMVFLVC